MVSPMKAVVSSNGVLTEERVVLVTGAFGFIGSNLVRFWLKHHPNDKLILLDSMTYAARPDFVRDHLKTVRKDFAPDVHEEIVDIRDQLAVSRVVQKHRPDLILHLAAESHVCRSIAGPKAFMETNIMGTFNLIEEFYQLWKGDSRKRFVHVSTDEVFGELKLKEEPFSEKTNIKPRSPYAASKASSDHIVQCYHHTYKVPTIITNCSNNFGPNQHEEKLIPATIKRVLNGIPILLHGTGMNIRDWLFVEDHCRALSLLAEHGKPGERYCIGGEKELTNADVVYSIHKMMSEMNLAFGSPQIEFRNDRPTDDRRYAIDCSKLKDLGWSPNPGAFAKNLSATIAHYVQESGRAGADRASEGLREGVPLV